MVPYTLSAGQICFSDPNGSVPEGCIEIKDPCEGNPVENPRIAEQTYSGVNGGRFGMTRSGGTQKHDGIDIANDVGNPWYSMYGGMVVSVGYESNLGNYVTIQSYINGSYYTIQYAHLQANGRPANGSSISAGDIIGKQGLSGNLERAIDQGYAIPHSHIVARKRTGSGWSLTNDYSDPTNPEAIMTTKFDAQGNPVAGTDC